MGWEVCKIPCGLLIDTTTIESGMREKTEVTGLSCNTIFDKSSIEEFQISMKTKVAVYRRGKHNELWVFLVLHEVP